MSLERSPRSLRELVFPRSEAVYAERWGSLDRLLPGSKPLRSLVTCRSKDCGPALRVVSLVVLVEVVDPGFEARARAPRL